MRLKERICLITNVLRLKRMAGAANLIKNMVSLFTEPEYVASRPLIIQIEPTINCNLKCKMCESPFIRRETRFLTIDAFKRILDQFPFLEKISLVGAGEPLLNPDLLPMLHYAKSKRIGIGFATNGTLLSGDLAEGIIASGVDWLNISVDGATKETYEEIRRGANFEKVLDNIRNFMSMLGTRNKPEVSLWFLLMKSNSREVCEMVLLTERLGIKNMNIQTIHYWGSQHWKNRMLEENIRSDIKILPGELKKAAQLAREKHISFDYVNIPKARSKRACKWPWRSCYITTDGYVTPCCMHGSNPELIHFGNIIELPFNKIWNSAQYRDFRKKLKSSSVPDICIDCTSYYDKIRL